MASDKRMKRLIHLIAHFPDNYPSTLEDDLKIAQVKLPTVDDRRFRVKDKVFHGIRFEPYKGSFSLQFATSVSGESISTLPNGGVASQSVQLRQITPPQGHDFSDGDIIALISGNNIFACPSTLRETAIASFIREIFRGCPS